jgi:hypothetical protein
MTKEGRAFISNALSHVLQTCGSGLQAKIFLIPVSGLFSLKSAL